MITDKQELRAQEWDKERRNKMSPELHAAILGLLEEWKAQTTPDVWEELRGSDPILAHFGLGMWIRNTYLYKNEKIQEDFRKAGYFFADDMSEVILEIWIEELNKQ